MEWVRAHVYLLTILATLVDATTLPFPGRLVLVVAGAVAASGDASVVALIALAATGAFVGDQLWYLLGRFTGRGPLRLMCRLAGEARRRCERRSLEYYRRWGGLAIIFGRFVAGLRIAATPLAAEGVIPYARYLTFEAVGALLWAGLFVLLGYGLGAHAVWAVEHAGWVTTLAVAVGVLLVVAPLAYRRWRARLARSS